MAAIMHKRKRSVDGSSLSAMMTMVSFEQAPSARSRSMDIASCLNSRTMKRFRDTRPPDKEIHERTLGLLYSAQQRPPQHQPDPSPLHEEPSLVASHPSTTTSTTHQQSLHHFWSIQSAPTSTTASLDTQTFAPPPPSSCEDCGAGLIAAGVDPDVCDGRMELDAGGDMACGACGKFVCFSCSVSNLGEQRRCLRCAGRRGVDWTVPVS